VSHYALTVVNDGVKEDTDLAVDFGVSGQYATRILDLAVRFCGYPEAIRTEQGSEFTGKGLDQWTYVHGI